MFFATIFTKEFKAALIDGALNKKLKIKILTNSVAAFSDHGRKILKFDEPLGYYAGLQDMENLLSFGIQVYHLKEGSPYSFLHRKLIIIGNRLFFGSHNLTLASSLVQEELNFEIVSDRLSKWAVEEFYSIIENHSLPYERSKLSGDLRSTFSGLRQKLGKVFRLFY